MYIWRMRPLSKELANNQVDENVKFKYFGLFLILSFLVTSLSSMRFIVATAGELYYVKDILGLAYLILGLYLTKKYNNKFDGRNYVERYICLNVPLFLRALVLGFISGIVQTVVLLIFKTDAYHLYIDLLSTVIIYSLIFLMLVNEFRILDKLVVVSDD